MFMLLKKWTSPKSLKFSLLPTDLVTLDHSWSFVFYTNYFNFCRSKGLSVIFVDQMAVGKKAVTAAILSARLLFCLVIWLSNLITVDIIQNVLSDIATLGTEAGALVGAGCGHFLSSPLPAPSSHKTPPGLVWSRAVRVWASGSVRRAGGRAVQLPGYPSRRGPRRFHRWPPTPGPVSGP
jgi:hypothetical protein